MVVPSLLALLAGADLDPIVDLFVDEGGDLAPSLAFLRDELDEEAVLVLGLDARS